MCDSSQGVPFYLTDALPHIHTLSSIHSHHESALDIELNRDLSAVLGITIKHSSKNTPHTDIVRIHRLV